MWDTSASFSAPIQVVAGTGTGSFSADLTGLIPATAWYVRAFASNITGTGYGNTLQFSTVYTANAYTVSTFAGGGSIGANTGEAMSVSLINPVSVAVDPSGIVYIAHQAPEIYKVGTDNMVSILAKVGQGGSDMVVDGAGNIYDLDNSRVLYKITPTGFVSVLAGNNTVKGSVDGVGAAASFSSPVSMDIDNTGNLYVTDAKTIRKVTLAGNVSTLPVQAVTNFYGIAVDKEQNLYVADGPQINKIDSAGNVSFVAGSSKSGDTDGMGSAAAFGVIFELRIGKDGNIYATDAANNNIRVITPAGLVTTIAGTGRAGSADGNGTIATFSYPVGLTIDAAGNMFVADLLNNKIRKITHN
jgi:hypothetical protein